MADISRPSDASPPAGKTIGIDLGRKRARVAVMKDKKPQMVPGRDSELQTASYIAFTDDAILVGNEAKQQGVISPTNVLHDFLLFAGLKVNEDKFLECTKNLPMTFVGDEDGWAMMRVTHRGKTLEVYPETAIALLLSELKENVEGDVIKAVVTISPYLDESQREAILLAGGACGLEITLLNKPTAAALTFGLDKSTETRKKHIFVFDIGGGTLDASILELENGRLKVLARAGTDRIDGDDTTAKMVKLCVTSFMKTARIDMQNDDTAKLKLHRACEYAKRLFTSVSTATIQVPSISGEIDFEMTMDEEQFNKISQTEVDESMKYVRECFSKISLTPSDIDTVVLVGGPSRHREYTRQMEKLFNDKPIISGSNTETAVALGAAIHGDNLDISGPDEVCGIQLIQEVNHRSVGVEVEGGKMSILIPKDKPLPTQSMKTYTTVINNQRSIEIKVFEGEHETVADNNLLGTFQLKGIPLAPKGNPKFKITFEFDIEGQLTVSAVEKSTGRCGTLTIEKENRKAVEEHWMKVTTQFQPLQALRELQKKMRDISRRARELPTSSKGAANSVLMTLREVTEWINENEDITAEMCEDKMKELDVACGAVLDM